MNPSAMPRFRVPAMVQSPLTRERRDIRNEGPDQPQLRAQLQAMALYERCGYRRRATFGAYPDNGLSLFYEMRLGQ